MKKIIDFAHVGDYKTGTTFLQSVIFPQHPEVELLPIGIRSMTLCPDLYFEANYFRQNFIKSLPNFNENKITGISAECISQEILSGENAKRNAKRIKAVFGNIKIIYIIREQKSMLASLYSEYIKLGGYKSFKSWFLHPALHNKLIRRLKYHRNIQMYYDIFGKENVKILLYDEFKNAQSVFLAKMFKFIGCKNTSLNKNYQTVKINTSLTKYGVIFSRMCNKLFSDNDSFFFSKYARFEYSSFTYFDKLIYSFLSKGNIDLINKRYIQYVKLYSPCSKLNKKEVMFTIINKIIQEKITLQAEKIRVGSPIKIPKNIENKLHPYFKDSNNLLKTKFNLEVDKYNWLL